MIKKMKTPLRDRCVAFYSSFKIQLLVYYTVASMVVLALGSYFGYTYIMNVLKDQNERYVLLQFQQSDNNMRSFFNEIDRLSNLLLQDSAIEQFVQYDNDISGYDQVAKRVEVLSRINSFLVNYNYINSIYIFTESGGVVGSSARNSLSVNAFRKDEKFYLSEMYRNTLTSYSKISWYGALKADFFNERIKFNPKDDVYLITAVKENGLEYYQSQPAIIVFNFDERYLSSIYSGSLASGDSLMTIVDNSGKIISSSNGDKIGQISETAASIRREDDNGSFTIKDNSSIKQIVYYKIKNTNWYLLEEMPITIFTKDIADLQKIQALIFIISILLIFAASIYWLGKITNPLKMLGGKMSEMSEGRLGVVIDRIPKNELGIVITRFNEMSRSIVELLNKNEKIQNDKHELEIEALQSQINPHFLYNTLNMIKWMAAIVKAGNIVDSITALGNILKPVYNNTGTFFTLKEELDYVDNYIKIMNWRFGNGVHFWHTIPESYMSTMIPRFTLQPLLENAIIHGMRKPANKIDIEIGIEKNDGYLVIMITDSGVGIPPTQMEEMNTRLLMSDVDEGGKSGSSIGVMNVNKRIQLSYGDSCGIKIKEAEAGGTKILIYLPKPLT